MNLGSVYSIRFCVQRIWWHRGERTLAAYIHYRHTGPSPGVMIHNIILETLLFILDTFKLKNDNLSTPPFAVRLKVQPVSSYAVIVCDPTMEEFQDAFLKAFDYINQVLSKIPTMQCWIEEDTSDSKLKVAVTEFWMNELKSELKNSIGEYYEEILKMCEIYMQRFEYILSAKSFTDVENFLQKKQDFFDVCEHLKFYLEKKAEVNNLNNQKELPLMCIDLSFFKAQLIALHDNLIDQLKTAACEMLSNIKRGLCSEFETLQKKLLTVPETAKGMVVLTDLFDKLRANEFQDLLAKVKDALSKTIVLMNLITLGPEELKINSELLLWPKRMKPVFKKCAKARRNRRQTAGEIARHTTQATGRPISRFTVAKRMHGGGLFARRPVRCVPLTPAHRRRRSLWCREHRNWRDNEWGRVLFTDESRFSLSSDSHRILIWRER
ncbi:dynein heavy chain 12, axonemal [Trichonephila clavipes]|nr:dynein heavy chain 12, axonemal [Trichonephila clavipes]